jgi:hypothetical protein
MSKLMTCILLLLVCAISFSQAPGFHLQTGPNISFISIGDPTGKAKIGFHVGVGADLPIKRNTGITAELMYSQKGGKNNVQNEITTSLDYVVIPILFYLNLSENFKLQIGPELSFLINARAKSGSNSNDIKRYYETFDLGAVIGGKYHFNKFGLGLRYVRGLIKITELTVTDQLGNIISQGKAGNNNVIQISLFYNLK